MTDHVDYTSLVPRYTFTGSREKQERQLQDNPLLRRMNSERRRLAQDPYRPIFHYVNPEGYLNDPNGLCRWQGNWHLFYQAQPPEDPREHWGHAVSEDLVHWRDLPYAIYPEPERACYSGSTLVERDRVIAMYHGKEAGNMIAVSSDPLLLNWQKVTGGPVIPLRQADGSERPYKIHDPCIWRKADAYYSLSAGTHATGPGGKTVRADVLFRSSDLIHWEYLHEFVEGDFYTSVGDDGACPYFWPIGDKHILLFFSHMSGGQYLLGDYDTDRDKFVVTDGGKFNFGPFAPAGVHAPSATPDGDGGVIVIFNMNSGKPTEGCNQIMSLPRRLTLDPSDETRPLRMEPAGGIASLRGEHQRIERKALPANHEMLIDGIEGNSMELVAVISPTNAPVIEMNVFRSPDGEERTRIQFYRKRGYRHRWLGTTSPISHRCDSLISIDTSRASLSPDAMPRAAETAPVFLVDDEPLTLRVFVDRSVVEVFVNGRQCLSVRVYPSRSDSVGVSFLSRGCDGELRSLDAWRMKSIYAGGGGD